MIDQLKAYDFYHNGFMTDGMQSIPLGNGSIGANVWMEQDGVIRLLFSRTDAWSEACRLIKAGLYSLSISPNPFKAGAQFHFSLADATLYVHAEGTEIRLYMDKNAPCMRLSVSSAAPVDVCLTPVNYRDHAYEWPEDHSNYHMVDAPVSCPENADVLFSKKHSVGLYHFNEGSCYEYSMRLQSLDGAIIETDPLLHRIFGSAAYSGELSVSGGSLCASGVCGVSASIFSCCLVNSSPEAWLTEIDSMIEAHGCETQKTRDAHITWWKLQWERCHVLAKGDEDAFSVTRAFLYQRYMNLCAGEGEFPIKFNGSIYTADQIEGHPGNYDARRWGGPYWIQNTRLLYWAMLSCGDYGQMKPFLRMCVDLIPISRERVRAYWNHEGMLLPETFTFFGTHANCCYGYPDEQGIRRREYGIFTRSGDIPNRYIRWHYSGMVEIAYMMMRYVSESGDTAFLPDALRFSQEVMLFFMNHFETVDGKLMMIPVSSMETWQHCLNDLPDISGLTVLIEAIEACGAADETLLALCSQLKEALPALPVETVSGKRLLSPCEVKVDPVARNVENPELYAVFPFGQYALGKPDLQLARDTYFARRFRHDGGWSQDPVQSALLGLTAEAKRHVIRQSRMVDKRSIFPAFWGPNFDETPDQDHGSNILLAVAAMLSQRNAPDPLLPAWPKEWDVEFRLPVGPDCFVKCIFCQGNTELIRYEYA